MVVGGTEESEKKLVIRILTMFDVVDTSFSTFIFSEKKKQRVGQENKKTFLISPFTLLVLLIFMYIFVLAFFHRVLVHSTKNKREEMARHDDY